MEINMVFLLLLSVAVGLLGSLTGLGGASILVPVLVLLDVPVKEAIASAVIAIIATSSGSAASYVRDRITNIRIAMYLEMFTVAGAIIGATITSIIQPVYLYFFFALFLLTSFARIRSHGVYQPVSSPDNPSRWLRLRGSYFDRPRGQTVEYHATNAIPGGLGMIVAGLAAGMLGIGAGAFKVTVQENVLRLPPKVASATSNFIIGMTGLGAVSVYIFSGLLNLSLMAPMAVGTTLGALVGGRLLPRLPDGLLRVLFLAIAAYLIVQMLYKGIALL